MHFNVGILGVIIHFILLYSIFDIYYTSPVIQSLPSHEIFTRDPPAKRLFLISADGLRYDTFVDNPQLAPFLHSLISNGKASWGKSVSHVPTESRPGHISMIAGFTEDVSAVTRGWKDNPVIFDTLFNRSIESYQWGSEDITHLFSKVPRVKTQSFSSDLEDFASLENYKLDEWVFDRCENSLIGLNESSLKGNGRFFFLHLVSIDTNGHGHKPYSNVYKNNLAIVDKRIRTLSQNVEKIFKDNDTAFIFTSDHGMTDWGSHGGGSPSETDCPFVIWGSGVNGGREELINQVDICPLVSSLISIPIPINNHGIIPHNMINASSRYITSAIMTNFFQLREIVYFQISMIGKRWWLSENALGIKALESLELEAKRLINISRFGAASSLVASQLHNIQSSIFLYHRVDRPILGFSVSLSFISFIFILIYRNDINSLIPTRVTLIICCILSYLLSRIVVSYSHIIYLILPFYLFSLLSYSISLHSLSLLSIHSFISILPILLLVLLLNISFYNRSISSLFPFIFMFFPSSLSSIKSIPSKWNRLWYCLCLLLIPFPFFPPAGLFSLPIISSIPSLILSIILRKIHNLLVSPSLSHSLTSLSLLNFILIFISSISSPSFILRSLCWISIPLPYILVYRTPPRSPSRLISLSIALFLPYSLVSSSYESIFLLFLLLFLFMFTLYNSNHSSLSLFLRLPLSPSHSFSSSSSIFFSSFPLLLIFLSLFSTGNLASLSSFDPSSLSRLVSIFSPYTMATLLILKLLSPVLLIFLHIRASLPSSYSLSSFISPILIISDLLSIIFFWQLRDTGSWLDIGMSIAHYVISISSSLAVYILFIISDYLLSVPLSCLSKHLSNA